MNLTKDEMIAKLNARMGVPNTEPAPTPPTAAEVGARAGVPNDAQGVPTQGTHAQYEAIKAMVGQLPGPALDAVVQATFPMHATFAALQAVFEPSPSVAASVPPSPSAAAPVSPSAAPVPPSPSAAASVPPTLPVVAEIPEGAEFWFEGWFFNASNQPIEPGPKPEKWIEKDGRWKRDGRGRPKGSTKPKGSGDEGLATMAAAVTTILPAIEESAKQARAEQATKVGMPIDTLYVKCYPIGQSPVSFSALADKAHAALAAQGMSGHYSTQEYGKGKGFWAMAIQDQIQGLGGRDVFVDLASTEALDALSTLERFANRVVRGF